MKKFFNYTAFLFLISLMFTSCDLAAGIFKAGFGIGIFAVIAVVVVIIWLVSKFSKK